MSARTKLVNQIIREYKLNEIGRSNYNPREQGCGKGNTTTTGFCGEYIKVSQSAGN